MTEPTVRHVLDNDVFFAALYEGHAHHRIARRWLDIWLVHVAHVRGAQLTTRDKAFHRQWPERTVYAE